MEQKLRGDADGPAGGAARRCQPPRRHRPTAAFSDARSGNRYPPGDGKLVYRQRPAGRRAAAWAYR